MANHLGHGKHEPVANPSGNTRNGKSKKTLKGEFGELPIDIPRGSMPFPVEFDFLNERRSVSIRAIVP